MRSHFGRVASFAARRVLLMAAIVLAAGCASTPTGRVSPESAPRAAGAESSRAPTQELVSAAPASEAPDAAAPSSPLADILADRRRGDYPEIAVDEAGFTITEQIRVGGAARADYEQALILLRQERYAEGIPLLVRVTELAPDVTSPYVDLGIAYGRSGDLEHAVTALETAKLLSPGHPIVHNELGILYRKTGRFAEARASYETALATYSDFHFARRNLAVLCDLYLADLACALEHYTAYIGSVDDDPEVEIWIADLRNRLGQ